MKTVGKYNLYKGISTVLTVGTPIITLLCTSDVFIESPGKTVSATAVLTVLIVALFFKDKLAENFKCPSAFVLSLILFILITVIESILQPMKVICLTTMIASGIDELTFKKFYKTLEYKLPKEAEAYKHLGFLFTSSKNLGDTNGGQNT